MLANKSRGRDRSASELVGPSSDDPRLPESVYLPRAASYTYFPQVKELFDEAGIVELKGTISEDELKASKDSNGDEGSYSSSGGTSPEAEVSAPFERLSLQQTISRRSSRFLLFGSQNQDNPDNSPTEKLQRLSRSSTDPAKSRSPSRSFSRLKRKSWISQSRSSSPSKDRKSVV